MRIPPQMKMFCWLMCTTILVTSVSSSETMVRSLIDSTPIHTNAIQRIVTVLENKPSDTSRALKKVFLSNRSITCNDGSQAGFYLRKSHTSRKWIVFLEGGWYCYDSHSCRNRWLRLRSLMTSSHWPETRDGNGILSPIREENPFWWNANHVLVPYCTSDSWSGTRMTREGMFSFMGAYVVQQVIRDLVPLGLGNGTDLLLAGSSAGGTGAMVNLDPVRELLHDELRVRHIVVRGVCDSGWFLDRVPYTPSAHQAVEAIRKGMDLWQGRVPKRCARQYPDEPWRCYFGYRLYPTLKAPLFVFQWLFDEAQMTVDNVGAPVTKQQWDYIHKMGNALRQSFENVTAVFAPSCISHSILTKREWKYLKVNHISIAHALHCWAQQPKKRRKIRPANAIRNVSTVCEECTLTKGIKRLTKDNNKLRTTSFNTTQSTNKHRRRKKRKQKDRNDKKNKRKVHRSAVHTDNKQMNATTVPIYEDPSKRQSRLLLRSKKRTRGHGLSSCHLRLLERCTWPQCNLSCPKLHNPFTGEEMDFLELLKSFGLDMESVAKALGIDMQTLNNMDQAELLNLLTQQAN